MANNVFWGVHAALNNNLQQHHPVNPTILMIGDSWFWYPFNNLAQVVGALRPNDQVLVVGKSGAEAAEWATKFRKDIDYAFKLYAEGSKVLLLSGGGNDVAGMKDFPHIIKENCSAATDVGSCYAMAQPDTLITGIMGHYRALIQKFRAYNATAPVVLHHYDYAWPTGQGVFGPADWLKEPMVKAGVPETYRRALFRDLIERLKAAQQELAQDASLGPIRVANTAGVLPDNPGVWANELHPTPQGFNLLAEKAILPILKQALG